jgi:acyl carrier protein
MDELQLKILEIVKSNIEKEEIQTAELDTDLSTVGMDSITFIRIVVALEEAFEIEVPDDYLLMTEMNTIEKMTDVIAEALATIEGVSE